MKRLNKSEKKEAQNIAVAESRREMTNYFLNELNGQVPLLSPKSVMRLASPGIENSERDEAQSNLSSARSESGESEVEELPF